MRLSLLAPAKINLHLRVGKRRGDGFHPLLTWMCTVGLFDTLTLEAAPPVTAAAPGAHAPGPPATERAGGLRQGAAPGAPGIQGTPGLIRFDCDRADLPCDEGNLVVRIARAFAAEPSVHTGGPAFGATGSGARREGDGADVSAGAATVAASGIGGADRPVPVGGAGGGTGRGADAARDAERSVGNGGDTTSPSGKGRGRKQGPGPEAPGAPAQDAGPAAVRTAPAGAARLETRDVRETRGVREARIALAKRIPVGAGLGGGSSDAARALLGLNRLWEAGWAADRLSGFAARFGSDVPFFVAAAFHGPSAACAGRGEIVRPIPPPAPKWAVLVLPPFALATRDVYGRFDELGLGRDEVVVELGDDPAAATDWRRWAELPARDLLPRLVNDLEPAAFSVSPALATLRADVEHALGRVVRMSGSGSSLFTLFDAAEQHDAAAAAESIRQRLGVTAAAVEVAPALNDGLSAESRA